MKPSLHQIILLLLFISISNLLVAQVTDPEQKESFRKRSIDSEHKGLAESYKGITNDGKVQEGLFGCSHLFEKILDFG